MQPMKNIKGRHGVLDIFMDVSHTLEMSICVVNQLKNDSNCQGLYCLRNSRPLNVLNDLKLILNDQRDHSESFGISVESYRNFRGFLFLKPKTAIELLFGSTVHNTGSNSKQSHCLLTDSLSKKHEDHVNYFKVEVL